ncbi:hypothetical protein BD779DRAFT_47089 [Infundibulicybe gibba]|nr:hypothetical protein BD779DRAFT_47089 [Infundibulicybe gibba]
MITPSNLTTVHARGPLHFLAHVVTQVASEHTAAAGPSTCLPNSDTHAIPLSPPYPLGEANSLMNIHPDNRICRRSKRMPPKIRREPCNHLSSKLAMQAKRKQLMDKAVRIQTVDNSPANEQQLLVLRMVYDEITMYPSEAWMVLIAIVIRRAFKQVKNWFSNERQKHPGGLSISARTELGEKIRLRPIAYQTTPDQWSDNFFENVIMVYNYRTICMMRSRIAE